MCCQGWLFGEAHGHIFFPGTPCHFSCDKGCSVYPIRPDNPCKIYNCAWKVNAFLPEWFKPDISNVICSWRTWKEDETYLEVIECGKKIDSSILSWLFIKHLNGFLSNFTYKLDGGQYYVGSNEFLTFMGIKKNDI
jgi:hypothetical protein